MTMNKSVIHLLSRVVHWLAVQLHVPVVNVPIWLLIMELDDHM